MSGWLEDVEHHAAEATELLRRGSLAAYPGCTAHLEHCIRGLQNLLDAVASSGGAHGARPRVPGDPAVRLRGAVSRLQALHQQTARFYLGRLHAITAECGSYAPGGWRAPEAPPRMRVEV
jgi:hypothetical protein